jgi:hypothetical protein
VKGKCAIDSPVPVDNDIPESSHRMDFVPHELGEQPLIHEMQKDIFVFTGYAQIKIRIEDSADIKYILNGKFNSLVDTIFYQTKVPEFFHRLWQIFCSVEIIRIF